MISRALFRLVAALLLAAPLLFATVPAAAQDESAHAAELKKRADDLMDGLKYTEALALYAEAFGSSHDPALLYNMGRAYEALGQYPEALDKLEQFQDRASAELKAKVPGLAQRIADVRAHVATLVIKSPVAGARVLVRDKLVGQTPLQAPLRVSSGRAVVEIVAEGYQPFRRELDLAGGKEQVLDAQLQSKTMTAVLVVQSPVVGADASVDGKPVGKVPAEAIVGPGSHSVLVQKDGYEPSSSTAVLSAGERKTLSIPLETSKPITAKWWFWTAIGVVVVAGTITTIALLTERPADKGTYPPGQVSGPLVRF